MRRLATALTWLLTAVPSVAQIQGVELDAPVSIPAFAFDAEVGDAFTQDDLDGRWTLVVFGFLSCPDVCPFMLGNLEAALSETGLRVSPENMPQVVFVSVDPARDAGAVAEYARYFHPDFLGVTGARDQIDILVEATDSFYRVMEPRPDGYYEVQHSASVSVIAPDGTLRAKLQPPFDPGLTAEFLARLQIAYRREAS